jgi:hypothetical protein
VRLLYYRDGQSLQLCFIVEEASEAGDVMRKNGLPRNVRFELCAQMMLS